MQKSDGIEILAPAGNAGTIEAAVRAGADAVYFGAPGFNARQNAKNLTFEDIAEQVGYCAARNVKTYLTLNTLVSDREREDALSVAGKAAMCGVDAFIVEDLGLAALLRKYIPDVPLHASTQMSVHSADALPILAKMGFTRVVPAREMDKESLSRLTRTAKELGMEVEAFVHGALCMCLSGQCYLSAVLGSRSGNRGLCAQPCRLPFSVNGGTGHDLSLRDMSLIEHIDELRQMGVCSLKIEGRMKRPEYVAAATAACRAAVDGETVSGDLKELLSGIFSRNGHTDGYFTGKTGRSMFGVRTESDEKISAKLVNTAHELYRAERRSVPLNAEFLMKSGQECELILCDFDGHKVSAKGGVPSKAKNASATEDSVSCKLSKLGGTPFFLDGLKCDIDDGLYISAADIGVMKREASENLEKCRRLSAARSGEYTVPDMTPGRTECKTHKKLVRFKSAGQIPEDIQNGISAIILPAAEFENIGIKSTVPLIAEVPRGVMKNADHVINMLKAAKEKGAKAAVIGNIAGFFYADAAGLPVIAGIGMNVFNSDTVAELSRLGAVAAVASFELTQKSAARLGGGIPVGIISYGRLPLMCFKNCPGKNGAGCKVCGGRCELSDRLGEKFPVMCDGEFSEMLNSRPLWMLDKAEELSKTDFEIIYFTDETKERCRRVLAAADEGLAPDTEHTRGLYYRGVL